MDESPRPRSGSRLLATLGAIALVGICGALIVRFLVATPRMLAERAMRHEQRVLDLESIVTQVRDLSRLETAAMRVTHVSTITDSVEYIPDVVAGDEITLFAVGDVVAGIDLSEIGGDDVRVEDGTLVMHLPPARLLVSRIDNSRTRVLSRKTGLLRRADVHLEARARQSAELGIRREALAEGILDQATEAAQVKLASFLHALGARKVRFETSPVPRFGPG